MSNSIHFNKGLDIPLKGAADRKVTAKVVPDVVALCPSDFNGLSPRLLVREGDRVLAGSPVLADKNNPDILITAPASGSVEAIVRGEKRKLLSIRIRADKEQQYIDFDAQNPSALSGDQVKDILLKSGLFAGIVQRPYGIIADPALKPKAIFVSSFSSASSKSGRLVLTISLMRFATSSLVT